MTKTPFQKETEKDWDSERKRTKRMG